MTGYIDRSVEFFFDALETVTRPYGNETPDKETERGHQKMKENQNYRDLVQEAVRAREAEQAIGKQLKSAQAEMKASARDKASLREEVDKLQNKEKVLAERLHRRDQEIERLRAELDRMHVERERTAQLLATRTTELKGAQAFLTRADALSCAEVIDITNALNAEIFQAAAHIADTFSLDERGGAVENKDEKHRQRARCVKSFGDVATRILETTDHKDDPTVLQVLLQGGMVICAQFIAENWYPFDSNVSQHWSQVYATLMRTEIQPIAGRWRALALASIRKLHKNSDMLTRAENWVVNMSTSILTVAGFGCEIKEILISKFRRSIESIVRLSFRLSKAIGEEITSAEVHAICIPGRVVFNPMTMEDGQGSIVESGCQIEERVLCTTHLGIRKWEKIPKNEEERRERIDILKPKVALESLVQLAEETNLETI